MAAQAIRTTTTPSATAPRDAVTVRVLRDFREPEFIPE